MSINDVNLLGHLGRDPELRYTAQGSAVCNLNIATNRRFTDGNGEPQERTDWHRVVVWGKQAENCKEYLSKGRQVHVKGRLQTRRWEHEDGTPRWTTEVVAQQITFLGGSQKAQNQQDLDLDPPAGEE